MSISQPLMKSNNDKKLEEKEIVKRPKKFQKNVKE